MSEGGLRQAYGDAGGESSERVLEALVRKTEARTPELAITPEAFLRSLGANERGRTLVERFTRGEEGPDAPQILEALDELRIVAALAAGEARAARILDERYVRGVTGALRRLKLDDASLDDVLQRVRQKLLVKDAAGVLRIAEYAGQGRLRALLQVVATREALDWVRRPAAVADGDDDLLALPAVDSDPELASLRARFSSDFKRAFEASVKGLSSRERNLLRMHIVSGAPLDRLATMYKVHRATVVRWLASARATLLKSIRTELRSSTGATDLEIDDLLALVRSRLDLSLVRWWRTTGAGIDPSEHLSNGDASLADESRRGSDGE